MELGLTRDRAAQAGLGLGQAPAPEEEAARFEPLLVEGGRTGGDAGLDDRTGEGVLSARREFDSCAGSRRS